MKFVLGSSIINSDENTNTFFSNCVFEANFRFYNYSEHEEIYTDQEIIIENYFSSSFIFEFFIIRNNSFKSKIKI